MKEQDVDIIKDFAVAELLKGGKVQKMTNKFHGRMMADLSINYNKIMKWAGKEIDKIINGGNKV